MTHFEEQMQALLLEKAKHEVARAKAEAEKAQAEARVAKLIEELAKRHEAGVELPKIKLGSS